MGNGLSQATVSGDTGGLINCLPAKSDLSVALKLVLQTGFRVRTRFALLRFF